MMANVQYPDETADESLETAAEMDVPDGRQAQCPPGITRRATEAHRRLVAPYPRPTAACADRLGDQQEGGDGMSQDGMARLEEVVRAVVSDAEGTPGLAMAVLAAELRTRPKLLLDTLKELSDLGSQSRERVPEVVDWARELTNEVPRAFGFRDRWPNLVPVAQGIVDLMARQTQNYVETRGTRP